MAGSGRSREAKQLSIAGGSLLAIGVLLGSQIGDESFADRAHEEVGSYIAGEEFDKDSFKVDALRHPVSRATLDAAVRGAYRRYGEEDAYAPSPEARAVVLCAGAAANSLAFNEGIKNGLIAGGKLEEQDGKEAAAASAYTIAADGCQALLDGALKDANPADIVIPVDDV